MTDINTLNLKAPDPIDWDSYADGGGTKFVMPPKGLYLGAVEGTPEVGSTAKGYLQFVIPAIKILTDGPHKDFAIKFTRINTQKWPNRNGNGVGDFLHAHGFAGACRTNEDYIAAVQAVCGRPFQFGADWRGYHKDCGFSIKGMEKFPVADNGERQSWLDCPNGCQDLTDAANPRPARVFANLEVAFYVSQVKK